MAETVTLVDAIVVREFGNGTKDYRLADGVEIGVRSDGYIYWATSEGWGWVLANARPVGTRVLGDTTGWPTFHDDAWYVDVPVISGGLSDD